MSEENWKKIERVRQLRNDYGVAHYDLGDKIKQLDEELDRAVQATKEVITRYIATLRSNAVSEAERAPAGERRNLTAFRL